MVASSQVNTSRPNLSSLNGVNVDQLVRTINAIKADPEIALFKFRSTTDWIRGGRCQTKVKEFYGARQEDNSRTTPFVIEGDEPPILLGENHGVNAVEAVLHSLASCLSVGVVYNGSAMGIKIKSLRFNLEGELDLHAFLGLTEETRPGYKSIAVKVELDADAPREKLEELLAYVEKTSPVLDILINPLPVKVELL